MWKKMCKFGFCLNTKTKNQQVPHKLVLGGVSCVTRSGPACNKGHQTHTIFYVTTGSETHYLSEMSKYGKTRGQ